MAHFGKCCWGSSLRPLGHDQASKSFANVYVAIQLSPKQKNFTVPGRITGAKS